MYDDGEEFAKQIKATIIAGNPIIQNYLEGVSVQSDDSALDNILNLLEQETKKWKANQYYWKQVKEEDSQDEYMFSDSELKQFKYAFSRKLHADEQAIICLNI